MRYFVFWRNILEILNLTFLNFNKYNVILYLLFIHYEYSKTNIKYIYFLKYNKWFLVFLILLLRDQLRWPPRKPREPAKFKCSCFLNNCQIFYAQFKWKNYSFNKEKKGSKMLHELLLALLGFTGDLIVDVREHQNSIGVRLSPDASISDERSFKLAPDINFIDPSDRFYQFCPKHICFALGFPVWFFWQEMIFFFFSMMSQGPHWEDHRIRVLLQRAWSLCD